MAKRTKEEIAAWKAQMAKLTKKLKAMNDQEKMDFVGNHLIITAEGHRLSLRNTCLLLFQAIGDDFTPVQVGGFKQWEKMGRRVKKGQHSCGCIMVPMGIRKDDNGNDDDSDIKFRYVPVFDVSQTEEIESAAA